MCSSGGSGHQHSSAVRSHSSSCDTPVRVRGAAQLRYLGPGRAAQGHQVDPDHTSSLRTYVLLIYALGCSGFLIFFFCMGLYEDPTQGVSVKFITVSNFFFLFVRFIKKRKKKDCIV